MKKPINANWSLVEAINASWEAYYGGGQQSTGYRNSMLMAWGNVVGGERAVKDFTDLVAEYGSKRALAQAMRISVQSLAKIENFFRSLPRMNVKTVQPLNTKMVLNIALPKSIEEDREVEFKEINGANPIGSIKNMLNECAVSFLNANGGRILWGVRNSDRVVVGTKLREEQRDETRKQVYNKLHNIEPGIDPSIVQIYFHEVFIDGNPSPCEELVVIEVTIPKENPTHLYFTGNGEAHVRVDGIEQKLKGPQIQDWILNRIQ